MNVVTPKTVYSSGISVGDAVSFCECFHMLRRIGVPSASALADTALTFETSETTHPATRRHIPPAIPFREPQISHFTLCKHQPHAGSEKWPSTKKRVKIKLALHFRTTQWMRMGSGCFTCNNVLPSQGYSTSQLHRDADNGAMVELIMINRHEGSKDLG